MKTLLKYTFYLHTFYLYTFTNNNNNNIITILINVESHHVIKLEISSKIAYLWTQDVSSISPVLFPCFVNFIHLHCVNKDVVLQLKIGLDSKMFLATIIITGRGPALENIE